jgi:hypothetical protein
MSAAGLSFQAVAGTTYRITVRYEADTDVEMMVDYCILIGGTLTGYWGGDVLAEHSADYKFGTGITIAGTFTSSETGSLRVLLREYMQQELLKYSVTINEVVPYTAISYSQTVAVDGTPAAGKLSGLVGLSNIGSNIATAAGLSFYAEEGKGYLVSVKCEADTEVDMNFMFFIMRDDLEDDWDDIINWANSGAGIRKEATANSQFISKPAGTYRILLMDSGLNDLDYTVTIKEAVSYTDISYSQAVAVGGNAETGKLSGPVGILYQNSIISAAGLNFQAEEGKTYHINIKYQADAEVYHMSAGYNILRGGTLEGNSDDIISENGGYGYNIDELTVDGYFISNVTGQLRILLLDRDFREFDYTITIEEVGTPSYATLNYSKQVTVGGAPVSGELSETVVFGSSKINAAGLSFQAEEGKTYQISAKYNANAVVHMGVNCIILKSGALSGTWWDDYISSIGYSSGNTAEATINWYFTSPVNGLLQVLLADYELNKLEYTITIKEVNITPYKDFTYSQTVAVNGTPATGKLSGLVDHFGYGILNAAGLSFNAAAGNRYQISIKYESAAEVNMGDIGYLILNGGTLTGDYDDDYIYWGLWNAGYTKEVTFNYTFTPDVTGQFRILLMGRNLDGLNYTVTINEVVSYTTLNYFAATNKIAVNQPAAAGTLSRVVENFWGSVVTAAGLSFDAEAGETYNIRVSYQSNTDVNMQAGYVILTGGDLTGNDGDVISWGDNNSTYGTELTVSSNFTNHNETGTFRVFLFNHFQNNLSYSIHIAREDGHYCYNNFAADKVVIKEPTCVEQGIRVSRCSICGKDHNPEPIDADPTKHNIVWGSSTATCMSAGTQAGACNRPGCTYTTSRPANALGHSLTWNVTTAATCTAPGVETETCQRSNCTHTGAARAIAQLTGAACQGSNSVLSDNRRIPTWPGSDGTEAITFQGEFTAGPNPVERSSGVMNFFWQGKRIDNTTLTIFDASGNAVNKIRVTDGANQRTDRHPSLRTHNANAGDDGNLFTSAQANRPVVAESSRIVGTWDLKDTKGRQVSKGTYLVRGTITVDGKKERVSVMVGVR